MAEASYRQSLKSLDTEERIDLAFYRPLGYFWARLAHRFGISPNAITIASIFLGVAAAVFFYFNNLWLNAIGILLLVWANSFDSADGQLARITGQYSRLGRILDGLSGDIWFVAIYVSICMREVHFSGYFSRHEWVIWTLAVLAGIFHAKQAGMADYYRQFHLYFLKGEEGSELDSCDGLRAKLRTMSWSKDFFAKLTLWFYANYTANQEITSPAMQRLRKTLAEEYPDGKIPASFRREFRNLSLPLMKYTNILTFNWRSIALFVTLAAGQPWVYFVLELTVFNNLLLYMVLRHEAICRYLEASLKS